MGLKFATAFLTACCLSFSLLLGGPLLAAKRVIRIGTEGAHPPFNSIDASEKVEGLEVDLSRPLCDRIEVRCEFVVQEWDGINPALVVGKHDAIVASMSITSDRLKAIDFTDPYYRVSSIFIAPKGSPVDGTSGTLVGKRVGVQRASTDANYLAKSFGDGVDAAAYDTIENLYLDLKSGRLDAILIGRIAGQAWMAKPENVNSAQVGPAVYDRGVYGPGAGVGLRKGEDSLREEFNRASQRFLPMAVTRDEPEVPLLLDKA